ncbi:type II toxin-antitoxin system RelE/ParE family toxin [Spirulina sp. CS-785/01]|uniref:type II toxin-antitoxin system RelE/ParE family toxin n=1 Tax=Spirulina sp. CS-785/01 TaxID=3021716 RepID=UPI00232B0D38|nr:type II toxin-antitoxin system RelE/ParE family toxin [Spirulina sp. CS-785/01]MDB9314123.1 type II toxin-antitoxin system RelE/ParE family toxin [Spirulina sp. CS-785/01]
MEAQPREIQYYVTAAGQSPYIEWIESLRDRKARSKIDKRLKRVELGNLGDHKFIGEGVFELRINYGPGYRVYFGQINNIIILLLCGGDKSSQAQDILKAKQFWREYVNRQTTNN